MEKNLGAAVYEDGSSSANDTFQVEMELESSEQLVLLHLPNLIIDPL